MNILDTIKEQEELFNRDFNKEYPSVRSYTAGHLQDWVINWHKSSSKALLEAVIDMIERMKKEIIKTAQTESELLLSVDYGYNQALSDLQSKLKEEINNIKY